MQIARPVGRNAASQKYDILSALMAYALAGDKIRQRRVLRLMSLLTTRYNWQRDELGMGQTEIARLWNVDTRTVKREMLIFRNAGWLVLKRAGARGRVSVYGVDLERLGADTAENWQAVGTDFVERMGQGRPLRATESNVVQFHGSVPPPRDGEGTWSRVKAILYGTGMAEYGAWLQSLTEIEAGQGRLVLGAPSRFHARYVETHLRERILAVARQVDPALSDLRVEAS